MPAPAGNSFGLVSHPRKYAGLGRALSVWFWVWCRLCLWCPRRTLPWEIPQTRVEKKKKPRKSVKMQATKFLWFAALVSLIFLSFSSPLLSFSLPFSSLFFGSHKNEVIKFCAPRHVAGQLTLPNGALPQSRRRCKSNNWFVHQVSVSHAVSLTQLRPKRVANHKLIPL